MDLPLATEKPIWDVNAPNWGLAQSVQQAGLAPFHNNSTDSTDTT